MAQSRYLAALDAEQRAKLEQCQHVARLARRAHHGVGFRGHRGLGLPAQHRRDRRSRWCKAKASEFSVCCSGR
jgi:hypothetical protein